MNKDTKKEYALNLNTKRAGLSGVALKVSTAKNSGMYPVLSAVTGTGIITRILLSIALKIEKKAVSKVATSAGISEAYNRIEADNFNTALGKLYGKEIAKLPKPYGNYKTLKNRLVGEIKNGAILGFTFKNPEDSEVSRIFASVKI